jgi:hypothetical protein
MSEIVKAALIVAGAVIIGAFIITYWVMASLCSMQDSIKSLKAGVEDVAGAVRAIHFNTHGLDTLNETVDDRLRAIDSTLIMKDDPSVELEALRETIHQRLAAIESALRTVRPISDSD